MMHVEAQQMDPIFRLLNDEVALRIWELLHYGHDPEGWKHEVDRLVDQMEPATRREFLTRIRYLQRYVTTLEGALTAKEVVSVR